MTASISPQEFVNKWRVSTLKESSGAQQHFLDVCRLINHPLPAVVDPDGEWFTFEAGATEKELKQRTLTNLCNASPTWLELAHRKLDHAVLDAYGWPHHIDEEEILRRLLELNLERASRQD